MGGQSASNEVKYMTKEIRYFTLYRVEGDKEQEINVPTIAYGNNFLILANNMRLCDIVNGTLRSNEEKTKKAKLEMIARAPRILCMDKKVFVRMPSEKSLVYREWDGNMVTPSKKDDYVISTESAYKYMGVARPEFILLIEKGEIKPFRFKEKTTPHLLYVFLLGELNRLKRSQRSSPKHQ